MVCVYCRLEQTCARVCCFRRRSEKIAQAMVVRGFQGPEKQRLYLMTVNKTSAVANVCAVALLGVFAYVISLYR